MPATVALARNMERSDVWKNLIASDAAEDIGTGMERGKGFEKRNSVNVELPLPECVFCVFQDAAEILFSLSAKANPPVRLCQTPSVPEATLSAILLR